MSRFEDGLNPEQARAVATLDGPLLILAGAGSGKTRVLTRRVAAILEERPVRPWNVLAVTFTNKAAGEMRQRVEALVGEAARLVWIGTFHATCARILRQSIEPLGWRRDFVVYDDDDQLKIIKAICAESDLRINPKDFPPAQLRSRIDRAKNALQSPADVVVPRSDPLPEVYRRYELRLKAANALDFNDLVNKVVELLETVPEVAEKWRRQFQYVLVDEYQDTNAGQYRMIKALVAEHRNLAVVGDDDQSIYSFRGADIRNILDFEKDFPDATVVRLEQNYRSTRNILLAASTLVAHNRARKDKTLWTDAEEGAPLQLFTADDDMHEAEQVRAEIRRQLQTRRAGDIAIIYRTNAQSRPFEQLLSEARIPYVMVGGRKFYERAEIRDTLAYLRLAMNPADDVALARIINVPSRGIGDKTVETLFADAHALGIPVLEATRQRAAAGGARTDRLQAFVELIDRIALMCGVERPATIVEAILRESGYRTMQETEDTEEARGRLENLEALVQAAAAPPPGNSPIEDLGAFLDQASLAGQADELPDAENGAVTLLTAHLAKGLEFPVVFVVGLSEKTFPHARSETESQIEEERRLGYVALTRARERLFVSYSRLKRGLDGWAQPTLPSRFLAEIPAEAFGKTRKPPPRAPTPPTPPSAWAASRAAARAPFPRAPAPPPKPSPRPGRTLVPESMEAFQPGTQVYHPNLGPGTIARREGIPSNPKLTIHFHDHGPRTVFALTAGLEVLL